MEITLNLNVVLAVNQFTIPEKSGKWERNGITFAPGDNGQVILAANDAHTLLRAVCQNLSLEKETTFTPFSLNLQGFLKGVKPNKKNPLWISIFPKGDGTAIVEIEGEDPVSLKTDIDFMPKIEQCFSRANAKHTDLTNNHQNQLYFDERLKRFSLDKFFLGGSPLFTRNGNYGLVTYPNFPVQENGTELSGVFVQCFAVEDEIKGN